MGSQQTKRPATDENTSIYFFYQIISQMTCNSFVYTKQDHQLHLRLGIWVWAVAMAETREQQ